MGAGLFKRRYPMDYVIYVVNKFNMSETDILMTLFVAVLSLILFVAWLIDCVIKWRV